VSSRYTIRYRCRQGERVLALIVEDAQGRTYLFSGGALRSRATGAAASARLARLVRHNPGWAPVTADATHTLEDLGRLTSFAAARPQ